MIRIQIVRPPQEGESYLTPEKFLEQVDENEREESSETQEGVEELEEVETEK